MNYCDNCGEKVKDGPIAMLVGAVVNLAIIGFVGYWTIYGLIMVGALVLSSL